MWPFLNPSFSNARINKILAEIDLDQQQQQQQLQQQQQQQQPLERPSSSANLLNLSSSPLLSTSLIQTSSLSISKDDSDSQQHSLLVSFSPPAHSSSQNSITASQMLQTIQENDTLNQSLLDNNSSNGTTDIQSISTAHSIQQQQQIQQSQQQQPKKPSLNVPLFNKLIDQPNFIDEINLSKNQKLINYISQFDVLEKLIDYILYSIEISTLPNLETIQGLTSSHDIFEGENNVDTDNNNNSSSNDDNRNNYSNINSNNDDEIDKFERALQRSLTASEILILLSNSITSTLLTSNTNTQSSLMTKLWRGILNKDVDDYYPNLTKNEPLSDDDTPELNDPQISTTEDTTALYKEHHNLALFNNFIKLIESIASTNTQSLMNFIRFEQQISSTSSRNETTATIVKQFLKFIPFSQSICDLMVRLISTDKPYNSNGLIEILLDQDLIYQILNTVKIFYLDHRVQDNLCNLLNGIVGISSNVGFWDDPSLNPNNNQLNEYGDNHQQQQQMESMDSISRQAASNNPNIGPNDLTRQLVSRKCILEMLDILINFGNYGLVTVVSAVIEVIRKNNSDYDEFDWINSVDDDEEDDDEKEEDEEENEVAVEIEDVKPKHLPNSRDPIYLGPMLKLFSLHLDQITENYLTDKYYKLKSGNFNPSLSSSIGSTIEPLGYERFKIMELIAELLHCSNMILMNKSSKLDWLMYKRDLWRDVKKTESLVMDALNDVINDDIRSSSKSGSNGSVGLGKMITNKTRSSSGQNELAKSIERLSLSNENNVGGSISNTKSTVADDEFIKLPVNGLSVGNFFKLKLLETSSIPLIILKLLKFPWNNFMHNVVFDLVQQIFNGRLANWDEDQASNQEETKYDDNLSLNKILIWSLFGAFDDYQIDDPDFGYNYREHNIEYPGFFNLPNFILFCFNHSDEYESKNSFKLGYMGHLTLIAEEIHKFQNYVENFGLTRDDQTFEILKDENDLISSYYLKSSFYIFNSLFDKLFESDNFVEWNSFINGKLKEINSMYNKVLGNPNELNDAGMVTLPTDEDEDDNDEGIQFNNSDDLAEDDTLGLSSHPMVSSSSKENVIILDNGDSEDFHREQLEVIEGEEEDEKEGVSAKQAVTETDILDTDFIDCDGGDLRPMGRRAGDGTGPDGNGDGVETASGVSGGVINYVIYDNDDNDNDDGYGNRGRSKA